MSRIIRTLSRAEVPEGTLIGIFNDVHIGIHDRAAVSLMIECMTALKVETVIANGDIFDCGPVSPHPNKKKRSSFDHGALLCEAETGKELVEWMTTRRKAIMGTGNHEDWINDIVRSANLESSLTVRSALKIPDKIEVLNHGYQIRIGSLVIEHGDLLFGRSQGSKNLARSILEKCPDQSTIVGHFHRADYAVRTAPDTDGVLRSRGACCIGHMSRSDAHGDYAGRYPQWQQSFGIIRIYYVDQKPRFTVNNIEIHRDKKNRPYFEYFGRIYR